VTFVGDEFTCGRVKGKCPGSSKPSRNPQGYRRCGMPSDDVKLVRLKDEDQCDYHTNIDECMGAGCHRLKCSLCNQMLEPGEWDDNRRYFDWKNFEKVSDFVVVDSMQCGESSEAAADACILSGNYQGVFEAWKVVRDAKPEGTSCCVVQ